MDDITIDQELLGEVEDALVLYGDKKMTDEELICRVEDIYQRLTEVLRWSPQLNEDEIGSQMASLIDGYEVQWPGIKEIKRRCNNDRETIKVSKSDYEVLAALATLHQESIKSTISDLANIALKTYKADFDRLYKEYELMHGTTEEKSIGELLKFSGMVSPNRALKRRLKTLPGGQEIVQEMMFDD